ncbi:MAG: hypothetical protein CL824_02620, partial [Crocinitomicaceae bacterium]|nr:hypothetical protein [Crocinitomicaceae bacterium]
MRHNILFILLAFFVSGVANSQHANFNSQKNWSLQKHELQFGLGATQFLGDLGGSPDIGKSNSLKDMNLKSTGVAAWFGYRMRFHPKFATTSSICLFTLKGDDALSENYIRNSRNLHFRSLSLELQQRIEYILFSKEAFSPKYNFPGVRQAKNRNHQTYLFTGIGMLAFSPSAQDLNGEWHRLRPLNTEGQGDVIDSYAPVTLTVPFGFGMRFGINSIWRVGFEVAYVKTFSDYIDDVSTNCYENPNASAQSQYFSDPSVDDLSTAVNEEWFWNHGE